MTRTASVRAFPWHALDRTTREEALDVTGARRAAEELVDLGAITLALGAAVNARVELRLRSIVRADMGNEPRADGVGVLLAPADEARPAVNGVRIDVEGALAAALIARALKRPPPELFDPARTLGATSAGAVGAIVVAAARHAHAGAPLRVVDANSSRALALDTSRDHLVATFTVLLDDEAFVAWARIPRSLVDRAHGPARKRASVAALGDVPLRLAIVACATVARASEIAALAKGDAWMPGMWPLGAPGAPGAPGALSGPVLLAAATSERGLVADLGADGRVVIGGKLVDLAILEEGSRMTPPDETTEGDALSDTLGDVPVVVRVELGAIEMRAREWAALAAGDVVALGTQVTDPVVLRAGGVEIARGELVQIDGEVGVRIVERTAKEPTA